MHVGKYFYTIPTSYANYALCLLFASVHRRKAVGWVYGAAWCVVHVDVHGEVMLWLLQLIYY